VIPSKKVKFEALISRVDTEKLGDFGSSQPQTSNLKLQTEPQTLNEGDMKKADILLIALAIALVVGMLLTAFFGRGSRHGYGAISVPTKTIYLVGIQEQVCNNNLTAIV
jgi:hypothetical protein